MSDDPNLPFGHNTLKIRAVFIPDGAQVSMSDITRVVGFDPVLIRAVWVPPGGAMPGYPHEIIGQATFIPDSEDQDRAPGTGWLRPGTQNDPAAPDSPMPQRPHWSGSSIVRAARPQAAGSGSSDGDQAPYAVRPRRGVRSAQANFSPGVPSPHLDRSREAIDAAVRALGVGLVERSALSSVDYPGPASQTPVPSQAGGGVRTAQELLPPLLEEPPAICSAISRELSHRPHPVARPWL